MISKFWKILHITPPLLRIINHPYSTFKCSLLALLSEFCLNFPDVSFKYPINIAQSLSAKLAHFRYHTRRFNRIMHNSRCCSRRVQDREGIAVVCRFGGTAERCSCRRKRNVCHAYLRGYRVMISRYYATDTMDAARVVIAPHCKFGARRDAARRGATWRAYLLSEARRYPLTRVTPAVRSDYQRIIPVSGAL